MIFNVPGHIQMIHNGLGYISPKSVLYYPMPERIVKTQTRRVNRGIYQVGKNYAVQSKRGVKAEPDIRIVMDRIGKATIEPPFNIGVDNFPSAISEADAWAEGGYTPFEFEEIFQKLNPKWDGKVRWVFIFHVIEVQK